MATGQLLGALAAEMDEGLLNDLLECSVCLERLDTSSRVLPCQHTFCLRCLREIVYCQKELRCPECRVLVETPVDELPPNVLLMRILEGMRNSGGGVGGAATPRAPAPSSAAAPPHSVPRRPVIGPATFMEPVSSYGFTYSDGDGKHTNVIPKSTPHARALYDFFSKEPGDLTFKKDEVIILRRQIDTYWYHGETNGNQGAFPITFAKIIVPLPPPIPQCTAMYDFHMAAHEEEGCLAFNKGAVINVIRRVDENWAEGRLHDKIGIFPIAFVEMNNPALSVINTGNMGNSSHANKIIARSVPLFQSKVQQLSCIQKRPIHAYVLPNQVSYRQQQMSVSSPAPHVGAAVQRQQQQQHSMSQSHPVYLHQQNFYRPEHGIASGQFMDSFDHHESQRQSTSNTVVPAEAKRASGANVPPGYSQANNHSSDSSSTTTTPSFGGSSVTTTPNTSSSNTSSASESNTPSSPASPAMSGVQNKNNQQAAAATRTTIQGNEMQDDGTYSNQACDNTSDGSLSNTLNASTASGDSTFRNSPQNVNGNVPVAAPRSNVSSPQTCSAAQGNFPNSTNAPSQLEIIHNKSISPNHAALFAHLATFSNVKANNAKVDPHAPSSSSGQTSFSPFYNLNDKAKNENMGILSPRHGKDGLTSASRNPHSHHRDREKRNSLTPGGQSLAVPTSMNRRSAEILGTGSLLDQEFIQETSTSKQNEREKSRSEKDHSGNEKVKEGKDKSKKSSANGRQPPSYVALYAYKPQKADELELKKGGIYMVLEQCQDGWYKGCSVRTHKCGVFPGNYVIPATKAHQVSTKSKHQSSTSQQTFSFDQPKSSKDGNFHSSKSKNSSDATSQTQPPDLPPRAPSPGTSSVFPWSSSPKGSSSKSSDKTKEKSKSDKNTSTGVSLMKMLTGMKKSRSPPPTNPTFSMDNPVFEDCLPDKHDMPSTTQQPVHIRSGSCPSQLLQGAPNSSGAVNAHALTLPQQYQPNEGFDGSLFGGQVPVGGSISSAVAHRLFPPHHPVKGLGSQTLGPSHGPTQRRQARPTVLNAGFADGGGTPSGGVMMKQGQTLGRSSGDVPWLPVSTRHHHHRKSHSLDAGQQLKPTKESSSQAINKRFRCIVAYPPNSEYELELQVDDVVLVHKQWGEGWYKGTLERTGHTGLVPASFVEAC